MIIGSSYCHQISHTQARLLKANKSKTDNYDYTGAPDLSIKKEAYRQTQSLK